MRGWIGVDLDGTLAEYSGWVDESHIGEPIPLMVGRVKTWLEEGKDVRIFTARIAQAEGNRSTKSSGEIADVIRQWCVKVFGQALTITCQKDFGMIELWDDRCVQIIPNTGMRADGKA